MTDRRIEAVTRSVREIAAAVKRWYRTDHFNRVMEAFVFPALTLVLLGLLVVSYIN